MNLAMVIAVYATISKHLRVPLRFPGKPGAYHSLIEMTDAGLLAQAMVWAATDPRAANQAYNINNGDLFRWEEMWPQHRRATSSCRSRRRCRCQPRRRDGGQGAGLGRDRRRRHDLAPTPTATSRRGRSGTPSSPGTTTCSPTASKARRLGFHEYVDTFAMFDQAFAAMRRDHVIP